ncbi:class I SAM-dependent methyltransferase [Bordetella bronchialis]|uniref:Methyltransferase n=1 Tax=Bordetella bronchialis TaxID=463025 RepID=A0A193G4U2_9BORD|nr:methyltransferase domain-containing protein [Bordetella bronchialis]ANN69081.1 methyltransferase [Bordetella bronchialis]ANN74229.1 methyltransferase [Bordetella bronchialis]
MAIPYHVKFPYIDLWKGLIRGKLLIQRRLRRHLRDQSKGWPSEQRYTHGYFYQGLEELGITGAKPTGFRFRQYDVDAILKDADVLDIGSNCGFVAVYCARLARSVVAVELNPYLNRIAMETARHFKLHNVEVVESDFTKYETDRKFDVVLSFSNHHTIDGNLNMGFEAYIEKIAGTLKPGGYLLFESHNVFAPGAGGVGDDGDMEQKVAIMNRLFDIERYKMVRCFLKHGVEDLDKLFIVARRSDSPRPVEFDLSKAIQRYEY